MNAQDALQLTEIKLPSIINDEYESIIKRIAEASAKGKTDICFGFDMPNGRVVDRLRHDGFRFYSTGGDFMFPAMYSLTWKREVKKVAEKRWYYRFFK